MGPLRQIPRLLTNIPHFGQISGSGREAVGDDLGCYISVTASNLLVISFWLTRLTSQPLKKLISFSGPQTITLTTCFQQMFCLDFIELVMSRTESSAIELCDNKNAANAHTYGRRELTKTETVEMTTIIKFTIVAQLIILNVKLNVTKRGYDSGATYCTKRY